MPSRSKGATAISVMLKKLPEAVSQEIIAEMKTTGRDIEQEMLSRTPVKTGALKAGISYKVLEKSLKLQVGLLGTKAGRSKLFYGRILDLGRKAQEVQVTRHSASGKVSSYILNVSSLPALHFVSGRYIYADMKFKMTSHLKQIWEKAITRAAIGGRIED